MSTVESDENIVTESGIQVDLNGKDWHRFEDLPTYRRLSGQCVKEIDVCWLEPASDSTPEKLICLELKGYQSDPIPADEVFSNAGGQHITVNKLLANLEAKAKDTLLMFSAVWLRRGKGVDLAAELPQSYRNYDPNRRLELIMLVDEDNQHAYALAALRLKLRNRLLGMTHLLDFKLTLINRETAQNIGLPVSQASSS